MWKKLPGGRCNMKIDPETGGKIIGMLLAYAVSFLGLLLAYYNYKKRGPRAPDDNNKKTSETEQANE